MDRAVKFIRKNGRVIPIGERIAKGTRGALHVATVASAASVPVGLAKAAKGIKGRPKKQAEVKVNRALDLTGLGLSVASGAIGALIGVSSVKAFAANQVVSHTIDSVGIAANAASVAKGPGTKVQKAKQFARQEARNYAVSYGLYGAGLLGIRKNREAIVKSSQKILQFARKALRV